MYHQMTFCWNPRKISTSGSYLVIAKTKGKLGCLWRHGFLMEQVLTIPSGSYPEQPRWETWSDVRAASFSGGPGSLLCVPESLSRR